MIWYFPIKFLPTNLAMMHMPGPGLIMETSPSSSPHEQKWKAVPAKERWDNVSFPFFYIVAHIFTSISSPHHTSSDIPVLRLNPRQYHPPPHTNNNRKQGPGQVRLGCHTIFYTYSRLLANFFVQWNSCPLPWVYSLIFACLICHHSCFFLGKDEIGCHLELICSHLV